MTEYCMMVFKNKKYYGLKGFKQLYAAINPDVTIGEFTALCLERQEQFHDEKKRNMLGCMA